MGAAFLYGAAISHAAHRLVNAIPAEGLSMRIVFGIALALLMSPASGETLVERGAYLVNSVMVCHNCHTPRGPQGLDLSRALSGGNQVFDEPAFKVHRLQHHAGQGHRHRQLERCRAEAVSGQR
ncbi:hypothetical protein [Bradyrhizobium japonicum]